MRKIKTEYSPKPIPDRSYDWTAAFEDWDLGDPVGYGMTEAEALADLKQYLED